MNAAAIQHLRSPGFHLGTWLSLGSPAAAELAALCGFDWLLLDLEHGCGGESALFPTLQALRGARAAVVVRVGAPHPDAIQRALDWGADGIMVPHVDAPEAAAACVRCVRFPPRGSRGYSRSVRACDYGLRAPDESLQPLLFAQIESGEAARRCDAIAATDGVDALFVGPADLAFDLRTSPTELTYDGCLRRVAEAAAAAGKQAGILTRDDADAPALQAAGFAVQALDSDVAILRRRYADLAARFAAR